MKDNKSPRDEFSFELKVEHEVPADLGTTYANHLVVSRDKYGVFLNFFEICPPIIVGTKQERESQYAATGGKVVAKCVARIAVSQSRIPGLIRTLQTHSKSTAVDPTSEGSEE